MRPQLSVINQSGPLAMRHMVREPMFGQSAKVTYYRDNAYLRKLNDLLHAEMEASWCYREISRREIIIESLDCTLEIHREAIKKILKLIMQNQGLPEDQDSFDINSWLGMAQVKFTSLMPETYARPRMLQSMLRIETRLLKTYDKVLAMAPSHDRRILTFISDEIEGNMRNLPFLFR